MEKGYVKKFRDGVRLKEEEEEEEEEDEEERLP